MDFTVNYWIDVAINDPQIISDGENYVGCIAIDIYSETKKAIHNYILYGKWQVANMECD